MFDTLILLGIEIYQRHISPRKGWRCAYSVLHGGAGCSGAVKRAVRQQGWCKAALLARQRFRDCKLAAQMLGAQNGTDSGGSPGNPPQKRRGWVGDWCDFDPCLWLDLAGHCGTSGAHHAPCDCNSCDAAPCDCTPCDCNPCN
ncbi:hemolytic domain-containing protein [Abditibacterium utsteinense]|uniref:Hemolytic domain-containing protein n=1 Tax=Abditibacterium utsteinense TaxID=1960156 RepID=A0A2S8SQB6_9BACT|nr:membrane protein insertion efficiency factor YidD [Abditibacterium utsteinense]PQV62949.1 hemolytic domain-containing protein [Abditibacterium utsteinense]